MLQLLLLTHLYSPHVTLRTWEVLKLLTRFAPKFRSVKKIQVTFRRDRSIHLLAISCACARAPRARRVRMLSTPRLHVARLLGLRLESLLLAGGSLVEGSTRGELVDGGARAEPALRWHDILDGCTHFPSPPGAEVRPCCFRSLF